MIKINRAESDTSSLSNIVPASGQPVAEYGTATTRLKLGDGTNTYANLPYVSEAATYTSLADLGLDNTATIEQMVEAMEDGTIALIETNNMQSVVPTYAGFVTIFKDTVYRVLLYIILHY